MPKKGGKKKGPPETPEERALREETERLLGAGGDRAELRERLAEHDAGEDRRPREVPREVRLVRAHELGADRADTRLQLDHAVEEAVREARRRVG